MEGDDCRHRRRIAVSATHLPYSGRKNGEGMYYPTRMLDFPSPSSLDCRRHYFRPHFHDCEVGFALLVPVSGPTNGNSQKQMDQPISTMPTILSQGRTMVQKIALSWRTSLISNGKWSTLLNIGTPLSIYSSINPLV